MSKKKKKQKNKKRNKATAQKESTHKFWIITLGSLSLLAFVIHLFIIKPDPAEIENLDIITIDITLSADPVEKEGRYSGKRYGPKYYELKAKEYPLHRFRISGPGYRVCNAAILEELSEGMVVQIGGLKKELNDKLWKPVTPKNIEDAEKQNIITVYELSYEENKQVKVYLFKEFVEKEIAKNKDSVVLYMLAPLAVVVFFFMKWALGFEI